MIIKICQIKCDYHLSVEGEAGHGVDHIEIPAVVALHRLLGLGDRGLPGAAVARTNTRREQTCITNESHFTNQTSH